MEVVVPTATDVGHPREGAAAFARAREHRHLVAEVVADERERRVGQAGGQRPHRGLVRTHRSAVFVDALEHYLVLANMQALTSAATDRLNPDLGRSPEVVHRDMPRLGDGMAVLVE